LMAHRYHTSQPSHPTDVYRASISWRKTAGMSPDAPDGGTGNDRQDGRGGPRGERACAADVLSHAQLLRQGERAAWALTRLGLKAGDAVTVLLPMCLESVVVTLACVRLGVLRKTLPVTGCHASLRAGIRASGS